MVTPDPPTNDRIPPKAGIRASGEVWIESLALKRLRVVRNQWRLGSASSSGSSRNGVTSVASNQPLSRVYSLCFFHGDLVVPAVELIDAETDEEAMALARRRQFSTRRELWDRHRLVAELPPGC